MGEAGERLQKVLARAGLGSRRACEELIRQGRVTVDGRVAHLGQSVDLRREEVRVDGRPLPLPEGLTYLLLHKPAGVLSTVRDPHGRPTVLDLVPAATRLYPVGRLDLESEGLLLLTNDGELAYRLTHPRYEVEKEYRVLVEGRPSPEVLSRWRSGQVLLEEWPAPAQVEVLRTEGEATWLRVVLHEGRKRQIRLVAEALGHPVRRLVRVRLDGVRLGPLPPGAWRTLRSEEVARLRRAVGLLR
ncbi:MAG: pseudouridine synthase [Chloroflexia bacterium]